MAAAVINVVWQVASRYAIGRPSSFTEELARYLLIWIGLLGAAYATGQGAHLSIDLLPRALKGFSRRSVERCIAACVMLFALGVMVAGGSQLVWMTFYLEQKSAAMRLPLGYVYLAIPLSGLFMAFFAAVHFMRGAPMGGHGPLVPEKE